MTTNDILKLIQAKRDAAANLCDDTSGLSTDEVLAEIIAEIKALARATNPHPRHHYGRKNR